MGLTGEALPSVTASGWYLAGTWAVTGETKNGRLVPARNLFRGGYGAVELAGRLERMAFDATTHPGTVANAPRAENLAANGERVFTLGAAWYLDRHFKVQGNLVFEKVDDPSRSPSPRTGGRFPSGVLLVQFVM
jgi:phosphate-selective porin